ncbi:thiol-disulfide oxidoreductase DCC family protein [Aureitalea sp. L0-47]|uniref:thiol-disulfide oxidoreductase DCC family protein n=1 Tax=Aureitalea sp. L0-47 TaxID=2816962 RepID=UPI0022381469|nr:thiol-disulfide oxidoreductase DCC family protein [Aureitalea sp. L0-47]MCW5519370.1 thiol-disulfide oxidoreductase DCC family protein [Aureitalea sp. L0-47]
MKEAENHKIVLFDGVCNLCNGAVIFMIGKDKDDRFRFTSLQEETGRTIIKQYGIDTKKIDSIILIDNGKAYVKSTAALRIALYLKGMWPLLHGFLIFPKFIRDFVYDIIAKYRYKWFGKKESCMIPTPELKNKFI